VSELSVSSSDCGSNIIEFDRAPRQAGAIRCPVGLIKIAVRPSTGSPVFATLRMRDFYAAHDLVTSFLQEFAQIIAALGLFFYCSPDLPSLLTVRILRGPPLATISEQVCRHLSPLPSRTSIGSEGRNGLLLPRDRFTLAFISEGLPTRRAFSNLPWALWAQCLTRRFLTARLLSVVTEPNRYTVWAAFKHCHFGSPPSSQLIPCGFSAGSALLSDFHLPAGEVRPPLFFSTSLSLHTSDL